jgi:ADP-ribose pyrophosphatase
MTASTHPRWRRTRRTTLVESEWIKHHLDTITLPSGKSIDFHALEFPMLVAGVIPVGADGRILLTLQYRYMVDAFAWEIPAGNIPPGEDLQAGARRELIEETGHDASALEPLYDFHPQIGRSNHHFHLFVARDVRKVSDTIDDDEIAAVRWFTPAELEAMLRTNELRDGFTALAILLYRFRCA